MKQVRFLNLEETRDFRVLVVFVFDKLLLVLKA